MATIGRVIDVLSERHFEWKIEDFSALSTEDGKRYHSPLFHFVNTSWYLRIYPNGEKGESLGYIDVYLMRSSSGPPISLDYSLSLKKMENETEWHTSYVFEEPESGYGCFTMIERSKFLKRRSELGMPDVVTVICTMKCLESTNDATSEKLADDFKELMLNGDNRDTVIKVRGEEIRVHRDILVARNTYFSSMFKHDMKEKNTGVVSIDDCESDIFRTFVHFIYTGKVDKMSPENVCNLYEMADKYQEDQMKKECLHFMMKSLSEDTFCDYIVLALKYDEKKLFENSVQLFISKPKEIVRSVKWQIFSKEYTTQANELFIKTLDQYIK